jgi:hypothetical protein
MEQLEVSRVTRKALGEWESIVMYLAHLSVDGVV